MTGGAGPRRGRSGRWRRHQFLAEANEAIAEIGVFVDTEQWAARWTAVLPAHPAGLGLPAAETEPGGGTIEWLPPGLLLAELGLPAGNMAWKAVVAGASAALASLRASGVAHGELSAHRIWLTLDGDVVLLGAGRVHGARGRRSRPRAARGGRRRGAGRPRRDRPGRGLARPAGGCAVPFDLSPHTEEHTDASLSVGGESTVGRVRLDAALDEVSVQLGTDGGRGLLDDPAERTGWTDRMHPGEPTGQVTAHGAPDGPRHAALAALAAEDLPPDRPGEARAAEGRPLSGLGSLRRDEEPWPLHLPDLAPPPRLPWRVVEDSPVEITIGNTQLRRIEVGLSRERTAELPARGDAATPDPPGPRGASPDGGAASSPPAPAPLTAPAAVPAPAGPPTEPAPGRELFGMRGLVGLGLLAAAAVVAIFAALLRMTEG